MAAPCRPLLDESGRPAVRGYLHEASEAANGLALTHGAGSNCQAPLLIAVAEAFAAAGWTVLRFDLPFRQARPQGPPFPAMAAQDREGLRRAAQLLRRIVSGRVVLGGHSYGGRQATIAAAEDRQLADALLLLSYPLHPPRRPAELRTAHFPRLLTPAFFVHGTRDPFGSIDEMRQALQLVPAEKRLLEVERAGHNLAVRPSKARELAARLVAEFPSFAASTDSIR